MPSLISGYVRSSLQLLYFDGTATKQNISRNPSLNFTNGNGSSQGNRCFMASYTLAASGTQTLNLTTGLLDAFGNTFAITKLRALLIEHLTTTTSTHITIGGGTNPLFGTKIASLELYNGDHLFLPYKAGYTVSSGSADRILLTNADATNQATVRVTILGSA